MSTHQHNTTANTCEYCGEPYYKSETTAKHNHCSVACVIAHGRELTANKDFDGVTATKGTDPNNVFPIEESLIREIQRRFRRVRGLLRQTVGFENDALELSSNADPREIFDFPTNEGKKQAFIRQLQEWVAEEILEPVGNFDLRNGEHWTGEFIRNAYIRGVKTGQGRLMQEGFSLTAESADEILEQAVNVDALERLYTRAYENLQNITEDIADEIRRTLTEGFAEGWNPRKMANEITREVRSIERTRAVTLARTETINAATNAQLTEYEKFGVEGVQHVGRMTAKDTRVCPFCRAIDDITFTISEFTSGVVQWGTQTMRLGIPSHPNGRCTVLPMPNLDTDDLEPLEDRLPDKIRGKPVTLVRPT